jgi:hypothetical protein
MRTLLICHDDAALDRDGLARWIDSFSASAGVLGLREPRRRRRMARKIRRVGSIKCGRAVPIGPRGRTSAAWGQPCLSTVVKMHVRGRLRTDTHLHSEGSRP